MDLETYETLDLPFHEELKGLLEPEKQVEYYDIEGQKMIMKVL
jgi:translation elongation factor P/translation initiation factor 5A